MLVSFRRQIATALSRVIRPSWGKMGSVMKALYLCVAAFLLCRSFQVQARGKAEHVVVIVWDGMRPDFVTPQFTPTLYELAAQGTFFKNHHSAYVTSTEVNGTALATGMYPDHSGIMANVGYRPEVNWLSSYGTESLDAVRRGDLLTQGHYLESATVPEILQQAGISTIVAGAKPIALLHDRVVQKKSTPAEKESVTLFRGQSIPRSVAENLAKSPDIGAFPAAPAGFGGGGRGRASTNEAPAVATVETNQDILNPFRRGGAGPNTPDSWTTKALTRGLWRKGVPKYSILWLSEPDAAQHAAGVGSEAAVTALESCDKNLATVIKALEDKNVLESTDIIVVSDHGFSTIDRGPDVIEILKRAKFNASRQFLNPEAGDIMVVNLGGSLSFYVFEHDETVIKKLVAFLQGTDFAGVIFTSVAADGTFPLSQVHVGVTNGAPDVLVSMRWTPDLNENGAPGLIMSDDGRRGLGTHASLSRFDLHNTLIASGPDFKPAFVSETPSGNIDIAPTVLSIL
ncbi:MAG TPA: alkaline phosphatase family protein, partial [Candidatus Limnocylindria bacterium]|nr:alkaline phosphatase family protein [Candidatus Limnocylindria bacterium]